MDSLIGSRRSKLLMTLGLALLAVLGNHFHLTLFFGFDLIFGSIPALIAVSLLGLVPGVIVAAAGGAYTLVLWGHPYALVVLVLEVVAVGLLQRRMNQLALADALYWLFLGAPLLLALYRWGLDMEWSQALLVAIKQPLNGVLNAVIACFLMLALVSTLGIEAANPHRRVSIANLMFNTLLAATLLAGMLPVVIDRHGDRAEREREVEARLMQLGGRIAETLTDQPGVSSAALAAMQIPDGTGVALLAADGERLAEHGGLASLRPGGSIETVSGGLRIWLPGGSMAAMQRWREGRYLLDLPAGGTGPVARIRIEQTAAPLVREVEQRRLDKLSMLAVLTLVAVIIAALLSRWLTRSIRRLEVLSRNLSTRIASGTDVNIIGSRIAEYDGLAASIRSMAETLSTNFRELRAMRDHLEDRVRERTAALAHREAMLKESEARFRSMADAAPALIWLSDTQNLGTWYNKRWLDYTGRSLEQELGLGWASGLHPEDLDRCVRACNQAFDARRPFEIEFRLRRADGSYGWIADTGIPRFSADSRFEGYIGYCWDITDRKQAEGALRRQQRLGEVIAHAQSQFIREADRRAAFDGLLAGALALTESEYGFIGEVLHTADGEPYLKSQAMTDVAWDDPTRALYAEHAAQGMEFFNLRTLFGAALTGGEPVLANTPSQDPRRGGLPDGHPPLNAYLGIPIKQRDELVAVLGMANRPGGYDSTQVEFLRPLLTTIGQLILAVRSQRRHQEDQALLTRLSLVASQTTNGVVITDVAGRIEWINEGFSRITGYSLDELRGRTPGEVLQGPDTDPATVAVMREALRRRESFDVELVNYTKAGRPYWIQFACNPLLDAAGELQGFMAIESDVTEEKRAAEQIRASERRLAAVIEGTHIGTWEWNVQSGETVFNERWAEIVGYRLEELEPVNIQTWLDLAHPEDLRRSGERLERHFSGELAFYDVECRMRHKDGHWVWVHDRGRVVSRTADGKPLLMYGTHADISEQKCAEASLRASEAQYRSLVTNMPGAAYQCSLDEHWTMLYLSEAVEALTGYPADEFLGNAVRSFASLIHPDDALAVRRAVEAAVQARQAWAIEYRLHHRDGELRWVYERGMAVLNEDGGVRHLSGFIHDITDRKLAERTLQESALHTQTILDNVVDGIITIDAVGTVGSFNRSAERIFGYPAAAVIGRNVSLLLPEPYRSRIASYLETYRTTGVAPLLGVGREVEGLRNDGSSFPMDLAVSQIVLQGRPLFIGMVRDITERKRVEQMKNEFVSTVSHELRTPLTSISGALGLLIGGAVGRLPAQAQQMLDVAYNNSQRLTHLINDLLDMDKLVAGKLSFDLQVQDLVPLVEQALRDNHSYAAQYQVEFSLVETTAAVPVRVDGLRLQQVLANYLSNAAKFSPSGGKVEVAIRRHGTSVRVLVSDQGPGVPEAFRDRIFQKFSQADASDSRRRGGTGLGLAISKELIERMNGRVGFASGTGAGAQFYFDLPVAQPYPDAGPGGDMRSRDLRP